MCFAKDSDTQVLDHYLEEIIKQAYIKQVRLIKGLDLGNKTEINFKDEILKEVRKMDGKI